MIISELLVTLGLDSSQYTKGLQDADSNAQTYGSSIAGGIAMVGGAIVTGALAAAGLAVAGLGYALKESLTSGMDAEVVGARLEAILANTGKVTGVTTDMVTDYAEATALTTRFEDDLITSAGTVLAKFTQIGKDVFPDALQSTLDLAEVMGTDATSAASTLGIALADPAGGLGRLKRAGIVFTDEQEKMIKGMQEAGDLAGAQRYMLDALNGSIGGVAQKMGETAAGKMAIFNNTIDQMKDTIGLGLIPTLSDVGQQLLTQLQKPEVMKFIQDFTAGLVDFVKQVVNWLPRAGAAIQGAFEWLMNNKGVLVAAAAMIGVALVAFFASIAIAAWTAAIPIITALAPILLIMAAIGAIAYLVYTAWTQNWGGIQQIVGDAIASITAWWNGTLMPAIQEGISWFQTVLLPVIIKVANFLGAVLVVAIQVLSSLWTNVLLPALIVVWNFLSTSVFPLFSAIGQLLSAVVGLAVRVLAGLWQNILLPALIAVGTYLFIKLTPIFQSINEWIQNTLLPTFKTFSGWLNDKVVPAFKATGDAISKVIEWIQKMIDKIKNIKLPSWLTPGSPTPFELGLLGINDALRLLSSNGLPRFTAGLDLTAPELGNVAGTLSGSGSGGNNITFYITGDDPNAIAQAIANKLALQGVRITS